MSAIKELSTIILVGGGWNRGVWNILENLGGAQNMCEASREGGSENVLGYSTSNMYVNIMAWLRKWGEHWQVFMCSRGPQNVLCIWGEVKIFTIIHFTSFAIIVDNSLSLYYLHLYCLVWYMYVIPCSTWAAYWSGLCTSMSVWYLYQHHNNLITRPHGACTYNVIVYF